MLEKSRKYVEKRSWINNTLKKKILVDEIKMPFNIPHLWTRRHTALVEIKDKTLEVSGEESRTFHGG